MKDKIKIEHPDLWNRCRKQPKEINKRSHFRRCVVPLFANSDSDSDSVDGAAAEEPPVNEQAQLSASSSSSDEEDSPENEAVMPQAVPSVERRSGVRLAESLSDTEDGAKTKREKFDSGVSDLFESSSDRSPSSSDQSAATESSSSSSTTVDRNSASNSNPSVMMINFFKPNFVLNYSNSVFRSLPRMKQLQNIVWISTLGKIEVAVLLMV